MQAVPLDDADPGHQGSGLPPELCAQLLDSWECAGRDDSWACLPSLFARQAGATPEAVAVVFQEHRLSYRDLDTAAHRLAEQLMRLGAGPERLVAVSMPRSEQLVVALLAVLESGAAYLPIDPELPSARAQALLREASPVALVTSPEGVSWDLGRDGTVEAHATGEGVRLISLAEPAAPGTIPSQRRSPAPLDPAYTIYTSGSTGRPKGVVIPHAAIANRLLWMQEYFGIGPTDRVLQKTPFYFDVSVWEFFWPLITGATLVVAPPGLHEDPAGLAELIRRERITTIHFVPSMLALFLEEPTAADCTSLLRVICSGEALAGDLLRRFSGVLDAPLHNLYGPTEAAVDVSYWKCDAAAGEVSVPIGTPISNIELHVLAPDLTPVPPGEVGELHIAGAGLARGYLQRPGLTAERFVPDPLGLPGSRMYRTGDLARRNTDGVLEFLGRMDSQVKLHGQRIELEEIEAVLRSCPQVRGAACTLHQGQLVGYVVPAESAADAREAHTDRWGEIFEASYAEETPEGDLDLRSWRSSIDGAPMPRSDMREWRDRTVARMLEGACGRVLEIGCGVGLLAEPLLRHGAAYTGTDLAGAELQRLGARLEAAFPAGPGC